MGVEEYFSGIIMPQSALNTVVGTEELSITHPGFSAGLGSLANGFADTDVDPYPRAIISKVWTYNFENNKATSDVAIKPTNAYFCSRLDASLDAGANLNFGGVAIPAATSGDAVDYVSNFPLMPLMISASTS